MPHLPDHARHDPLLVAAYAAGDATGPGLEEATKLVASCPECAALHHDLRAIAAALPALPAAVRPRDFRLAPEQAAALRRTGWRRLLAPFAGPRFAFAGPLGAGLATLGLAGILVAGGAGLPLGGAAGAPPTQAAAPDTSDAAGAAGAAPAAMPAPSAAPSAAAASPATGAELAPPTAGAATVAASAAPSMGDLVLKADQPDASPPDERQAFSQAGTPAAAASEAPAQAGPAFEAVPATADTVDRGAAPVVPVLSALALIVGLVLAGLRLAGRRLAPRG